MCSSTTTKKLDVNSKPGSCEKTSIDKKTSLQRIKVANSFKKKSPKSSKVNVGKSDITEIQPDKKSILQKNELTNTPDNNCPQTSTSKPDSGDTSGDIARDDKTKTDLDKTMRESFVLKIT